MLKNKNADIADIQSKHHKRTLRKLLFNSSKEKQCERRDSSSKKASLLKNKNADIAKLHIGVRLHHSATEAMRNKTHSV